MISVIVPAFNAEKTITACIQSVLKQNIKKKFEVIVVDDGSSDRTKEFAREFYDSRIKLLKQKHGGPAKARNLGARKAKGSIVVFTDADCVVKKNWLKEMVRPFEDKEVVAVQGAYKSRQHELMARFVQIEIESRYKKMGKARKVDWVGSYSAAYRKKDFLKAKGFDENFPSASGEDPELSFKIAEKGGKIVFNPKAIVFHLHPASLFRYLKVKFFRAFWRIPLYKMHPGKAVKDSYTPQTLKLQIGVLGLLLLSVLAGWLLFSVAGGLFVKEFFWLSELLFLVLIALFLPFTFFALRKDSMVGAIAPFVLLLRSIVFLFGLSAGYARSVWIERKK